MPGYRPHFSASRYKPRGHSRTERAVLALYQQWREPRSIHGTNVVAPVLSHGRYASTPGHPLMAIRPDNAVVQRPLAACPYNARRCHRSTNGGQSGQYHRTTPSLRCAHCAHPWEPAAQPSVLSAHTISTDAQRPAVARRQSTPRCGYDPRGHSRTENAVLALYWQWREPRSAPSTNTVFPVLPHVSPSSHPGPLTLPLRAFNAVTQRPPAPGLSNAQRRLDQVTPSLPPAELAPLSTYARSRPIKAEAQCRPTSRRDNRPSQHRTQNAGCAVYGPGQSAASPGLPQQRHSLVTDCVSPGPAHCTHCRNRSQPRFLRWSSPCTVQQCAYSGTTLRVGYLRQSSSRPTDTLLCGVGLPGQSNTAPGATVDRHVVQCTVTGMPVHLSLYDAHTASHRRLVQCTVMEPTVHPAPYNTHTALYQQVVQCTGMGILPHWPRFIGENTRHTEGRRSQLARCWAQCTDHYSALTATTAYAAASYHSRLGFEVALAFAGGFHTPDNTLEVYQ